MGTVRNNPPWTYMNTSRVPYMLLTEKVVLSYFHIINGKKKNGENVHFARWEVTPLDLTESFSNTST